MISEDVENIVFNFPKFAAFRAEAEITAGTETTWRVVKKFMMANGEK